MAIAQPGAQPAARPRRRLLRWIGWFGAFNASLFALVALRYLWIYRFPDDGLGILYVLLAFTGQFALLACVPMFVLLAPVTLIWPSRPLVMAPS